MKVSSILSNDFILLTNNLDIEYSGCYATDLLSAAIKSAEPNNLLVTIINHTTTIALAVMIDLKAIIISENRPVTQEMIDKANDESIALIHTSLKTYEVIINLFQRGLI
ncbi:MAG: hypothetical protein NUK62_06580 [Tenericutes bacterium]|jgi:serine kinase of HPr protein (carbohydrate metabolism regulator)|nr:hypothetical protein [Mycoplasmatota bacterium]